MARQLCRVNEIERKTAIRHKDHIQIFIAFAEFSLQCDRVFNIVLT